MQDANWTEQLVAITVGVFYFTQKGKKYKHFILKKNEAFFYFWKISFAYTKYLQEERPVNVSCFFNTDCYQ